MVSALTVKAQEQNRELQNSWSDKMSLKYLANSKVIMQ